MKPGTERVQRRRDKMPAAGLRPIQIWVPDTRAPGFVDECRRQCEIINAFEQTPVGQEEAEAWDRVTADAWADLPPTRDETGGVPAETTRARTSTRSSDPADQHTNLAVLQAH